MILQLRVLGTPIHPLAKESGLSLDLPFDCLATGLDATQRLERNP